MIAIIGLAFSGIGTARTIWDWWHDRRSEGVNVKILLDDGTQVDLSGVDQKQLEIVLDRRNDVEALPLTARSRGFDERARAGDLRAEF